MSKYIYNENELILSKFLIALQNNTWVKVFQVLKSDGTI
jgi:hypothetical protein